MRLAQQENPGKKQRGQHIQKHHTDNNQAFIRGEAATLRFFFNTEFIETIILIVVVKPLVKFAS